MAIIYICPDCGHKFQKGEYGYDYIYDVLEFDCPNCGWCGTYSTVDKDNVE